MKTPRRTLVFGPAYLDRVLLVDRPLVDPKVGGVLDRSVLGFADRAGTGLPPGERSLILECVPDFDLAVAPLPDGWPGPFGVISSRESVGPTNRARPPRPVSGLAWHDDLGGMGAGFARALGGHLVWPAGDPRDDVTTTVIRLLHREGIDHRPVHRPETLGDWTLLITSGEFGDKLAVCFRSPSDVERPARPIDDGPCDLLVAASMTNGRASSALRGVEAAVKLFAPSIRNMADREPKVSQFAREIDVLCCNRLEWESLVDREEVAWRVSILAVTDGPRGATIRFTDESGEPGRVEVPAFPRLHPPKDTNRAGEAFASGLVTALLDGGWTPGVTPRSLIEHAAERASAAAALVLDRADFGFATSEEVSRAIGRGAVG